MAGKVIVGAQCWWHKWDVSGEASQLEPSPELEVRDHRPFSGAAVAKEPGILNTSAVLRGVLSFATGNAKSEFFAEEGNRRPLILSLRGATAAEGHEAYGLYGITGHVDHPMVQGDLHEYSMPIQVDGNTWPGLVLGYILAVGTKTVTGVSGTLTLPAVAAGQTVCAIQIVTGSPTGTLDMTIQSDDDGGFPSPTTRFTFAQVTTSATSEAKTLYTAAGITDTKWRASWTSGGTPSHPLVVFLGIH